MQIESTTAKALVLDKHVSVRNKLTEINYHFVKAALQRKVIIMKDVKSADNTDDILTKAVEIPTTLHLSREMRLIRD